MTCTGAAPGAIAKRMGESPPLAPSPAPATTAPVSPSPKPGTSSPPPPVATAMFSALAGAGDVAPIGGNPPWTNPRPESSARHPFAALLLPVPVPSGAVAPPAPAKSPRIRSATGSNLAAGLGRAATAMPNESLQPGFRPGEGKNERTGRPPPQEWRALRTSAFRSVTFTSSVSPTTR